MPAQRNCLKERKVTVSKQTSEFNILNSNDFLSDLMRGDVNAFKTIQQILVPKLMYYLENRLNIDKFDAEDIVQEGIYKAILNANRFDSKKSKFSTWVFTIVYRLGYNSISRNKSVRADRVIDNCISLSSTKQTNFYPYSKAEAFYMAVSSLSPRDRKVIENILNDKDSKEIAKELSLNIIAYRKCKSRALIRLENKMKEMREFSDYFNVELDTRSKE